MICLHLPRLEAGPLEPLPFAPYANLPDEINLNICRSEIEGGVLVDDLPTCAVLEVQTGSRSYILQNRGNGRMLISGHPLHCPQPVLVQIDGSTWGKSMIKTGFIGLGMYLEYRHPTLGVIRTSRIWDIRERPSCEPNTERQTQLAGLKRETSEVSHG